MVTGACADRSRLDYTFAAKGLAMEYVYLISAVAGGVVLVCQFVMALVGLGGDHDVGGGHDVGGHDAGDHAGTDHHHGTSDHDAHSSWFVGMLTFRTLVAALTFFGLAGMAVKEDFDPLVTLVFAGAAGFAAMFLVAWMMRGLHRLKAEGNVRIERAVGARGTVYLSIPADRGGMGKVLLNLQNRIVEYDAISAQGELPTGAKVVVTGIVGPGTVEVAPAGDAELSAAERSTHV
jgi:hypothetical protein